MTGLSGKTRTANTETATGDDAPRLFGRSSKDLTAGSEKLWLRLGSILAWAVLIFLVAPVIIIIVASFDTSKYLQFPPKGVTLHWYESVLNDDAWRSAFYASFRISILAAFIATFVGGLAAWGMARVKLRGKSLLNILFIAPMVIPIIVMALAYYFGLSELHLIGNEVAISVVYSVLGLPVVVLILQGALEHFDPNLESASRTMGAGPMRTLFRITIPQVSSAVIAGALFAFVLAFDEAVVILFVSGSSAVTVPRKLWDSVRYDLDPQLAAVGSLLILMVVVLLLIFELLRRFNARSKSAINVKEDE